MEGSWGAEGYDPAEDRLDEESEPTPEELAALEEEVRQEAEPSTDELHREVYPPLNPEEATEEHYGPEEPPE